jgi:hypothetical protein
MTIPLSQCSHVNLKCWVRPWDIAGPLDQREIAECDYRILHGQKDGSSHRTITGLRGDELTASVDYCIRPL